MQGLARPLGHGLGLACSGPDPAAMHRCQLELAPPPSWPSHSSNKHTPSHPTPTHPPSLQSILRPKGQYLGGVPAVAWAQVQKDKSQFSFQGASQLILVSVFLGPWRGSRGAVGRVLGKGARRTAASLPADPRHASLLTSPFPPPQARPRAPTSTAASGCPARPATCRRSGGTCCTRRAWRRGSRRAGATRWRWARCSRGSGKTTRTPST